MNNPVPQPPRVDFKRIFLVMAAIFSFGLAIGLLLYPSIRNPAMVANLLIVFGSLLTLSSLWEEWR
jgi:hypothetical protein